MDWTGVSEEARSTALCERFGVVGTETSVLVGGVTRHNVESGRQLIDRQATAAAHAVSG